MKQKHPGVITLDHQSLRSGVIFGSGSGARAREGEFTKRILVNAYDANSPIESGGTGWGRSNNSQGKLTTIPIPWKLGTLSSHDDDADKRIDRIYRRVKTFASSSKIFILESRKIWRFHPVVLQKTNGEY